METLSLHDRYLRTASATDRLDLANPTQPHLGFINSFKKRPKTNLEYLAYMLSGDLAMLSPPPYQVYGSIPFPTFTSPPVPAPRLRPRSSSNLMAEPQRRLPAKFKQRAVKNKKAILRAQISMVEVVQKLEARPNV